MEVKTPATWDPLFYYLGTHCICSMLRACKYHIEFQFLILLDLRQMNMYIVHCTGCFYVCFSPFSVLKWRKNLLTRSFLVGSNSFSFWYWKFVIWPCHWLTDLLTDVVETLLVRLARAWQLFFIVWQKFLICWSKLRDRICLACSGSYFGESTQLSGPLCLCQCL